MYSLNREFQIVRNTGQIPVGEIPSYIHFALVMLCIKGSARITVHGKESRIEKDDLTILFPGQHVSFVEKNPDFVVCYFYIGKDFFNDVLSGMRRFSPHFFFYMRHHFRMHLSKDEVRRFLIFFRLVYIRMRSARHLYLRESIIHILRIFYLDLYNAYQANLKSVPPVAENRKEELTSRFFRLLIEHYCQNRDVAYYAGHLCVSPKYLSMVVKEVSGKSAKDWILEYILLEIKALLKSTTLNIQEIVERTRFADQSSLARFFKKHTGCSPTQYRLGTLGENRKQAAGGN